VELRTSTWMSDKLISGMQGKRRESFTLEVKRWNSEKNILEPLPPPVAQKRTIGMPRKRILKTKKKKKKKKKPKPLPFREIKITPRINLKGKFMIFLGEFSSFSERKTSTWFKRKGAKILSRLMKKTSVAILGSNIPEEHLERIEKHNIETWDEEDVLIFIATYYLKSDFIPAFYRVDSIENIDVPDHEFQIGDEVELNDKKKKNGKYYVHVTKPIECWIPEDNLARIFEMWRSNTEVELFEKPDPQSSHFKLKCQTVMTNYTYKFENNTMMHVWYPKSGWIILDENNMDLIKKCTASEFITSKLSED